MKRLTSYFLIGLATLLPVVIVFAFIVSVFSLFDRILAPVVTFIFGEPLPGVGFLLSLAAIVLIGFLASSFLGKKLIYWGELLLYSIPLLGKIYGAIKRIIDSIFSTTKKSFQQVALVEFPCPGQYSVGFITNEDFSFFNGENYSLFIPTTPNPTNGFFVLVAKEKVQILDLTVEQGIELVISAGMSNKIELLNDKEETA